MKLIIIYYYIGMYVHTHTNAVLYIYMVRKQLREQLRPK